MVSAYASRVAVTFFGLGILRTQAWSFCGARNSVIHRVLWYFGGRQIENKRTIEMATCISEKRNSGRMDRPRGGTIDLFCGRSD